MNKFLYVLLLLAIYDDCVAQRVEEIYPDTLYCPNDTFYFRHKDFSQRHWVKISTKPRVSPGGGASKDDYIMVYYGKDSISFRYHNKLPYSHRITVPIKSPKGISVLVLRFDEPESYFPKEYISKNTNKIQFDIPEPYELANIIWLLSPTGQRATDLWKEGDYYKKVLAWFQPYANHPIFKSLDFPDSVYFEKYYGFRENSFAFNFKNGKETALLFNGPYYYVNGRTLADSSLFGKLKPLIEDFAAKSKFRQFYKNNQAYYKKAIERQQALLPVRAMWDWLQQEFPKQKFASYRIVFSPLISGSHSTQNYATYLAPDLFRETVMFVCGTDRYDKVDSLTERQREGLMSGIVFTEIDHNYVNPNTSPYAKRLDTVFSNRDIWVTRNFGNNNYASNESVFNEYMTHALFCLYVKEHYDKATADFVIDNRENMMVNRRQFILFREFDEALFKLREEHRDKKVVELYPHILEWCARRNVAGK